MTCSGVEEINITSWGEYAPDQKSIVFRFLIALGFGRGALREKILKTWRKKFGNIVDIRVRDINYRLNIEDNVTDCKILASSIEYDKKEITFLQNACKGGVFVDIGANIGYYTLSIAKANASRVIAIEPNPSTLNRLYFNVAINERLKNKISVVPFGVGEKGEFDLHLCGNLGGASLHSNLFETTGQKIKIQTLPLLDILNKQDIQKIDGMKIDIEGMEDRALVPFFKHAPLSMLPRYIVLEDDHKHMWEIDLHPILLNLGYIAVSRANANAFYELK